MEVEDFHNFSSVRQYIVPIIIGGIGLVCLLIGFFSLQKPKDSLEFVASDTKAASSEAAPSRSGVLIDVAGAVKKPGVYLLGRDARVQDAITAAGGFSDEADEEQIGKLLNLAAKLSDGGKVYIPRRGETTTTGNSSTDPLVNINTASESELENLPGIGAVTAGKIVQHRPYSAPEDLQNQKIVSSKVFSQIKELITIY